MSNAVFSYVVNAMRIERRRDFSPGEMRTVVLLAIGILAAVADPFKTSHTTKSKWFGANVSAVKIQKAIRDYARNVNIASAKALEGENLANPTVQKVLNVRGRDLEDGFFTASDYTISAVDSKGLATIRVTSSKADAPRGLYLLQANGDWVGL